MKVCLLTNEMYPFLPGGIGRLMFNFCEQNQTSKTPVDLHYLLPDLDEAEREKITEFYRGKATIHFCPSLESTDDQVAIALSADDAFHAEFSANYKDSISFYHGMLQAEAASHGAFDIIEVADMGGWGQAIIAAKRAGIAFQDSLISCRLHSSVGLITEFERYSHHPSTWFSAKLDLERETILGADLIVGHVHAIVKENARHYHLDDQWIKDTLVEFPPILLDTATDDIPDLGDTPDFVFSSRLQPFKRPDIFVRAAVLFLERAPDYQGTFRLLSYGWDTKYIEWLNSLVPVGMRQQVVFQTEYTQEERNRVLKQSVVVVPSNYESLCLFAYESSMMMRPVILARDCVAFGGFDRWIDGENCLQFDGSFMDLADVMEKAIRWRPTSVVDTTVDQPYWERSEYAQKKAVGRKAIDPKTIPVVYYGILDRMQLNEKLVRHMGSAFAGCKAYFLVPESELQHRGLVRDGLTTIVPTSGQNLSCSEVEKLILSLETTHVFLARADHRALRSFVTAAINALAATPDLDLFSSHIGNRDPLVIDAEYGVTLSTGEAPGMAMLENTVAPPMALIASSAIRRLKFDPQAADYWFEVFTRKLALEGRRIVISPSVLVEAESRNNERGNSKTLSAGIMDDEGIKHGLPARLLGMDVRVTNKEVVNSRKIVFSAGEFASAKCVWPDPNPRDFDLVMLQQDNGGLLTHPINEHITIAKLSATLPPFVKAVELDLRNASNQNLGVDFGLLLSRSELTRADFEKISAGETPEAAIQTAWMTVKTMGSEKQYMPINSNFTAHVYLMSRLPEGIYQDDYCWAIWKNLTFFQ